MVLPWFSPFSRVPKYTSPSTAVTDITYIAISKIAFKFLKKSNISNIKYTQSEKLHAETSGYVDSK